MSDVFGSGDRLTTEPIADVMLEPVEPRRLSAALNAVRAAVTVCRIVHQRSLASAHTKSDCSPVTIADFASQAVVVRELRRALGTVSLVAEEERAVIASLGADYLESVTGVVRQVWPDATADAVADAVSGGAATPAESGFWTLDPVDGTKGFLRNQQYAIALAYVEQGRPTVAVLGCPNLSSDPLQDPGTASHAGIICFAVEGGGAFQVSATDPTAPARRLCAEPTPPTTPLRVCASVERAHGNASLFENAMHRAGLPFQSLALDSQCKYAVVARGQAEAYVRVPSSPEYAEWIWDHAAGSLVAVEAGCRVTDLSGRSLDFGRGRQLRPNGGVLCATAEWHAELLRAVEAAGIGDSADRLISAKTGLS
jgi:3'(2'), 5'-bisphosphate nucleotidase